jgi:hypothetical protein
MRSGEMEGPKSARRARVDHIALLVPLAEAGNTGQETTAATSQGKRSTKPWRWTTARTRCSACLGEACPAEASGSAQPKAPARSSRARLQGRRPQEAGSGSCSGLGEPWLKEDVAPVPAGRDVHVRRRRSGVRCLAAREGVRSRSGPSQREVSYVWYAMSISFQAFTRDRCRDHALQKPAFGLDAQNQIELEQRPTSHGPRLVLRNLHDQHDVAFAFASNVIVGAVVPFRGDRVCNHRRLDERTSILWIEDAEATQKRDFEAGHLCIVCVSAVQKWFTPRADHARVVWSGSAPSR